jgi:catechol 2,3-dioxygenase-like lactoylglutathione lyase family enzyme
LQRALRVLAIAGYLGSATPHTNARFPAKTGTHMEPVIDHIQITVRDFPVAVAFYDRLMPLLGFNPEKRSSAAISTHDFQVVEYSHPRLAFAITSPRQSLKNDTIHRRRPGSLHHLAFRVKSREEVDKLHREVIAIGAVIVSPPREYPEYKPAGYYALFFKDLEGIKYEIVTHSECQ